MGEAVHIEPVTSKRALKGVVKFPFELYHGDPYWVPPLIGERIKHLDPNHNPFFEHADMQVFAAIRDGELVGTIAAIDDEMHPRIWNEPVGFFGLFEVIEDYDVAQQLFSAARRWLANRGRKIMRGPMNLNINDECGMLIEGFEGRPVIMMPYNKKYYPEFLERHGFRKAKDLYAYRVEVYEFGPKVKGLPERLSRLAQIAQDRYKVQIRPLDLRHISQELDLIKPIHRKAWSQNWGALPMTDAEYDYLAESLRQIVDPDMSYLAFIDGEPVGCFLVLPDYYEVLHHLNGHLFPVGWAKLLWYQRRIKGLRILIMGVLEEHRLKGVEALFYREACRVAYPKGYRWAEMSWILEDNYKVIRGIERMGGVKYRTYRIYDIPTA